MPSLLLPPPPLPPLPPPHQLLPPSPLLLPPPPQQRQRWRLPTRHRAAPHGLMYVQEGHAVHHGGGFTMHISRRSPLRFFSKWPRPMFALPSTQRKPRLRGETSSPSLLRLVAP